MSAEALRFVCGYVWEILHWDLRCPTRPAADYCFILKTEQDKYKQMLLQDEGFKTLNGQEFYREKDGEFQIRQTKQTYARSLVYRGGHVAHYGRAIPVLRVIDDEIAAT